MRLPILTMIIFILLNAAVDYYVYRMLKKRSNKSLIGKIHFFASLLITLTVVVVISLPRRSGSDSSLLFVMWSLFSYLSIYLPKYIFILFDAIASIPLLWKRVQWKWLSVTGRVIGFLAFLLMWWGALVNRYAIEVNDIVVEIEGLPTSFDGYRIAQISDLHLGTYHGDTTFVVEFVDKLNKLNVDAVMFTGDIVNRNSGELIPYVTTLSSISAKDGVFSILGNHDYGDYSDWARNEDKQQNQMLMLDLQNRMGWKLLVNETEYIRRGNDSIAIIGVGNVGDPPFKNYGSLHTAYPDLDDSVTKILLTHNPAHWEKDICDNSSTNIALTMSGHTHAMQMELWGVSPAALRYKCWGGLYSDKSSRQKLYVNAGIGTVALPMRIGATPEITLITLKSKEQIIYGL